MIYRVTVLDRSGRMIKVKIDAHSKRILGSTVP